MEIQPKRTAQLHPEAIDLAINSDCDHLLPATKKSRKVKDELARRATTEGDRRDNVVFQATAGQNKGGKWPSTETSIDTQAALHCDDGCYRSFTMTPADLLPGIDVSRGQQADTQDRTVPPAGVGWVYQPQKRKGCPGSDHPTTSDSVQSTEEEPRCYSNCPHNHSQLEAGSSHPAPTSLPAATTHSLPSSTTSVPVLRPVAGGLPSNAADPQTLHPGPSHALTSCPQGLSRGQHPDGRFLPGPSPSSMLFSLFPQGMPMSWSPSKYYSASSALMPHPLGFYANPYFGSYHPPGFFSGLQYYPQSYLQADPAMVNMNSYYESLPQRPEVALTHTALPLEYLQHQQQQAGASDAGAPVPQGPHSTSEP